MINSELTRKLHSLDLHAFNEHLPQLVSSQSVKPDEILCVLDALADRQLERNEVVRQKRMRTQAKFRFPHAMVCDIDFKRQRVLLKKEVERLVQGDWVNELSHLLLLGPTGTAKTTTACAIGNAIILKGYKVLFTRFQELLSELIAADKREDRAFYKRILRKYINVAVLIIDDWATIPMTDAHRRLIFDLIEQRDGKGSLIITSQYKPSEWHASFGDSTIADAVLDRIVHASYIYDFKGVESYRKLNALQKKGAVK